MEAICHFKGEMKFEANIRNHNVLMDAKAEHGGSNLAPTPKELVLAGLCGCTGMDVVSLLKKMRVEHKTFYMKSSVELSQGHPAVFSKVVLDYFFEEISDEETAKEKVVKAVTLSMSKYCGVSAMIAKSAQIFLKIYFNNNKIYEGLAAFS